MLPAVGQGALAVFARRSDTAVREVLGAIEDAGARTEIAAERALLAALDAGCHAPVAARARAVRGRVALDAAVFSADGSTTLRESAGDASEA
jgi:hydroxymethylbilane synthase